MIIATVFNVREELLKLKSSSWMWFRSLSSTTYVIKKSTQERHARNFLNCLLFSNHVDTNG